MQSKTNVDWTKRCVFFTTFCVARHRPVRPRERSLEPLTETDGDETTMDNSGDDDAGKTGAVKTKIKPMSHRVKRLPPTKRVVTIRIAIGAALVLGALGGQTLRNDGLKNKTMCLWRAWITGSLMETTVSTRGESLRFGG